MAPAVPLPQVSSHNWKYFIGVLFGIVIGCVVMITVANAPPISPVPPAPPITPLKAPLRYNKVRKV